MITTIIYNNVFQEHAVHGMKKAMGSVAKDVKGAADRVFHPFAKH